MVASLKDKIIDQLIQCCVNLGAKSDLLTIMGSYQDTMSEEETLKALDRWNRFGAIAGSGSYGNDCSSDDILAKRR